VQVDTQKKIKHFRLSPTKKIKGYKPAIVGVGRYLVGRSVGCDIIIPDSTISNVHGVLEITPNGLSLYDMNSTSGTYIEKEKIVAAQFKLNQKIVFGNLEFILEEYIAKSSLPPVLPSLEPEKGNASILRKVDNDIKKSSLPSNTPEIAKEVPYIVYPLSTDPNSDYSEYIFEDSDELYPIFKYEHNKQAVEVMILFRDKVYSVDYLPEKDGVYQIAGLTKKNNEIEFPYLGKEEKVPFIEIHKGNCNVNQLHSYELWHLKDKDVKKNNDGVVNVQANDIVKLKSGELEIYVRKISSPPAVKAAPFFRRDKELRKYILFMFLLVLIPIIALNIVELDKYKDD
jgi:hypothetical protein